MASEADKVRRHTASAVLRRIDDRTGTALWEAASADAEQVERRLCELDREWDTDRVLETEASAMGLIGLALGAFVNRKLLVLPALVASGVLLHAQTGRYPLMPLFRRLGVRTAREIARERYALKALRGDFLGMDAEPPRHRAPEAVPAGQSAPPPDSAAPATPRNLTH
jgi:sirohydrochlorin ferrochelatase